MKQESANRLTISAFALALMAILLICFSIFYDKVNISVGTITLATGAVAAIAAFGQWMTKIDIKNTVENAKALKKEVDGLTVKLHLLNVSFLEEKTKLKKLKANVDENFDEIQKTNDELTNTNRGFQEQKIFLDNTLNQYKNDNHQIFSYVFSNLTELNYNANPLLVISGYMWGASKAINIIKDREMYSLIINEAVSFMKKWDSIGTAWLNRYVDVDCVDNLTSAYSHIKFAQAVIPNDNHDDNERLREIEEIFIKKAGELGLSPQQQQQQQQQNDHNRITGMHIAASGIKPRILNKQKTATP